MADFIKKHSILVLEHEKQAREAKEALTAANTAHAESVQGLEKQLQDQKEVVAELKAKGGSADAQLDLKRMTFDKQAAVEEKGHVEAKLEAMATVLEVAEARAREADLGLRGLMDEIHILRSANKVLQVMHSPLSPFSFIIAPPTPFRFPVRGAHMARLLRALSIGCWPSTCACSRSTRPRSRGRA